MNEIMSPKDHQECNMYTVWDVNSIIGQRMKGGNTSAMLFKNRLSQEIIDGLKSKGYTLSLSSSEPDFMFVHWGI